jgi:hypothetical protein
MEVSLVYEGVVTKGERVIAKNRGYVKEKRRPLIL